MARGQNRRKRRLEEADDEANATADVSKASEQAAADMTREEVTVAKTSEQATFRRRTRSLTAKMKTSAEASVSFDEVEVQPAATPGAGSGKVRKWSGKRARTKVSSKWPFLCIKILQNLPKCDQNSPFIFKEKSSKSLEDLGLDELDILAKYLDTESALNLLRVRYVFIPDDLMR